MVPCHSVCPAVIRQCYIEKPDRIDLVFDRHRLLSASCYKGIRLIIYDGETSSQALNLAIIILLFRQLHTDHRKCCQVTVLSFKMYHTDCAHLC